MVTTNKPSHTPMPSVSAMASVPLVLVVSHFSSPPATRELVPMEPVSPMMARTPQLSCLLSQQLALMSPLLAQPRTLPLKSLPSILEITFLAVVASVITLSVQATKMQLSQLMLRALQKHMHTQDCIIRVVVRTLISRHKDRHTQLSGAG
jgi:hypothetical protein